MGFLGPPVSKREPFKRKGRKKGMATKGREGLGGILSGGGKLKGDIRGGRITKKGDWERTKGLFEPSRGYGKMQEENRSEKKGQDPPTADRSPRVVLVFPPMQIKKKSTGEGKKNP